MPFHLYQSVRIEMLARQLGRRIQIEQQGDPLAPLTVVIPNRNLERWLWFQLADQFGGVAANLRFQYLDYFLQETLLELYKIKSAYLLTSIEERFSLEQCLGAGTQSELHYFTAWWQSRSDPTDARLARYNLAATLTGIFSDYERHRPDWIQLWISRPDYNPPADLAVDHQPAFRALGQLYHSWHAFIQRSRPSPVFTFYDLLRGSLQAEKHSKPRRSILSLATPMR